MATTSGPFTIITLTFVILFGPLLNRRLTTIMWRHYRLNASVVKSFFVTILSLKLISPHTPTCHWISSIYWNLIREEIKVSIGFVCDENCHSRLKILRKWPFHVFVTECLAIQVFRDNVVCGYIWNPHNKNFVAGFLSGTGQET